MFYRFIISTFIFVVIAITHLSSCRYKSSAEILTIATTTSLLDTGLADELLPYFEKKYHCRVKLIAIGTGQAIRIAREGNADVLIVHDKESEEKFVADGYGIKRIEFMRNDFIIVGPTDDPAGIKNLSPLAALKKIVDESVKNKKVFFVSRGDNSGTHKKELYLWKKVGVKPYRTQYIESGNGMEATLRIADEKSAYTITDSATFIIHKKEFSTLIPLVETESELLYNPYSVIAVSPQKHPHIKYRLAQKFIGFLTEEEGRDIIKNFGGKYKPLFIYTLHY